MRILHIISYFQPILGYQETYLSQFQMKKGFKVRVITSDRYSPTLYKGDASKHILGSRIRKTGLFIEEGIEVVRLKCSFEFLNNVWLEGLEQSIIEFNPDIIHVHGVPTFNAIRVSKLKLKLKAVKLIFDDHMNFNAMRSFSVYPFYLTFRFCFSKSFLKYVDKFVAITEETKVFMNKMYGLPLNKIDVIPLGCDVNKFYYDASVRDKLRTQYGISNDQVVFCYAGKVIPEKGVDLLIDASLKLMKSGKNIVVLCVGGTDQHYLSMLKNKIDISGFKKNFTFVPAVPSSLLYKYYSMSDIGVWPKQCSITMLEAMACSLPVIISDRAQATEGVACEGTGLSYLEGDVNDLSHKMELFIDAQMRFSMSEKALQVAKLYDWANISKDFEHVYCN